MNPHDDTRRPVAVIRRRHRIELAFGGAGFLLLILALAIVYALSIGRYPIPALEIVHFFLCAAGLEHMEQHRFDVLRAVIVDVRLPRVLTAVLVGAALSASGAAFQAVFRNPLVSPGLLGVMNGAAFSAALGMLLSQNWLTIQFMAFIMGLLAVGIGVAVGNLFGKASMVMLVLGGVISSGIFSSLLSLTKYVADPTDQLPAIVYWLMGNLGMSNLAQIGTLAVPILLCIGFLASLGKVLDVLSMGDEEARSLGVPVGAVRCGVIVAASLASALTVSIAGTIGWIGLIIPHIARMIFGPGNARLMPATCLLGAIFLLAADSLSRTVATAEIPIGIVTELVGIPIFLFVLHRLRRGWL